jgi:hypothetical protein
MAGHRGDFDQALEAIEAWYQRDRSAAVVLAGRDEELDELHASLIGELASG